VRISDFPDDWSDAESERGIYSARSPIVEQERNKFRVPEKSAMRTFR
jgi:hypothetical protein